MIVIAVDTSSFVAFIQADMGQDVDLARKTIPKRNSHYNPFSSHRIIQCSGSLPGLVINKIWLLFRCSLPGYHGILTCIC